SLAKKMIHRHPHVFGGGESHKSWEQLKAEEKGFSKQQSVLDDIVAGAPGLHTAEALKKRAATGGFDWRHVGEGRDKDKAEERALIEAIEKYDKSAMEEELGDLLSVLTNIARHYNIDAEIAIVEANNKFIRRFKSIEQQVQGENKPMEDISL